MPSQHQTRDITIFTGMVEILTSSILEEEKSYRFSKDNYQTHYEELATALNQQGFSNRYGKPLNKNALKQVVHRIRRNEKYKDIRETLKPDWDKFRDTDYDSSITIKRTTNDCLVCGDVFRLKDYQNRKLCSADCVEEYNKHKNVPCDSKFPTIYHQIKYENDITAGA